MKLAAWMKKHKITQATLAKWLDTNQPHVSDLVNEKVSPTLDTMARIRKVTKSKVDYSDWVTKERT